MNEKEQNEKSQPLGESRRRGIFARFLKKQVKGLETLCDEDEQSLTGNLIGDSAEDNRSKPDYANQAVSKLDESEIHEILDGINIERGSDQPHILHYVGGIEMDAKPDMDQTFSDYAKTHNLDTPRGVVSFYTGPFTKEDSAVIARLLRYGGQGMTEKDKIKEIETLSSPARIFMEEIALPQHLSLYDARLHMQKNALQPIAFYHNINSSHDLVEGGRVFFWIDDTFGGDITVDVGPIFNDSLAGPTAEGQVKVNLRGKLAGLLYWNTWQTNAVRWSVDPFLRSAILAEDTDSQIFTQL